MGTAAPDGTARGTSRTAETQGWPGPPPWRGHWRGGPPPWWPEDEAWPPAGPWGPRRHGFARRFGCLAVLLIVIGVFGLASLAWHVAVATGLGGPGRADLIAALVVGVVAFAVGMGLVGRGVRRYAVPLDDLIAGAERVEGGDLTARVPERPWGPPELRALGRAFNAMTARLETDERQRRRLLADITHELRTPLTVLQGRLEAMLDGIHPLDETNLEAALDETRVLGRLVEDLRTLALAEAGTLALHPEPTDLGVLAADAAGALEAAASERGVRIEASVADDVPLLAVDPIRIREVLVNLVGNALRYAPAGSAVRVTAAVADGGRRVRIAVADDGPGIPPELLPHVFDRFAKSAESRGSGLGLAIARQLVEAHGGTIGAVSSTGAGTTIAFELPVDRPAG